MTRKEFSTLTDIYPSEALYKEIETLYMQSDLDKLDFCQNFAMNKDGIAEKAQRMADIAASTSEAE